jgi:hypothetical protein
MNKRRLLGVISFFMLGILIALIIESSRTFIVTSALEIFSFLKENILSILAAFFLVKGKFILMVFLKKILLLSATGLGKRYLIEKVVTHNLKIHFLDYITSDIKQLLEYIKNNFKDFPLVKQIIAGFVFLGSLGFVGKFMGGMLAMKVFIAKVWSFLLVMFLKVGTAVIYFFTDYLWHSWLAPIVEVVIFSWILTWLEKVPYLKNLFTRIGKFFSGFIQKINFLLDKIFHVPTKKFFRFLAKKIKKLIYKFIQYKRISAWNRLREVRTLVPTRQKKLVEKRKNRLNSRKLILQKREERRKKI